MPRFAMGWLLSLAANAIALVLAWILLDGFHLSFPLGFVVAVIAFGIVNAIASWLVAKLIRGRADRIMPLAGLISTFLALVVTTWIGDGLHIDGVTTWILATLLIWIVSMVIWVIPGPWRASTRPRPTR